MPNFKSKEVYNDQAFCKLVHYIHSKPVHHGFVSHLAMWRFSSYHSLLSDKNTLLERMYTMELFGDEQSFIEYHKQHISIKEKWHDL